MDVMDVVQLEKCMDQIEGNLAFDNKELADLIVMGRADSRQVDYLNGRIDATNDVLKFLASFRKTI